MKTIKSIVDYYIGKYKRTNPKAIELPKMYITQREANGNFFHDENIV